MIDKQTLAILPGTFDPITNGHLDVIQRGARLFDRLIVAVGENPDKAPLFTSEERVEMIRRVTADLGNVEVDSFSGLTVDYVKQVGATAILRGIRSTIDLPHELQTAYTNRTVADVETVFILTTEEHAMTSSSIIKQVASLGGDVSKMIPQQVIDPLLGRLGVSEAKSADRLDD